MLNIRNNKINHGSILWNKAIDLIVGGCGLLSKRPTRYTASTWPSYYKKARGIKICSLNNIWYRDFTEFSIGCNLLGYSQNFNSRLLSKLKKSPPLTTLLSPHEPLLANDLNNFLEKDLVWRFTRGGGEALSLAVRFARSLKERKNILIYGYHGWHDWYLATNLNSNSNLDQIFLKGLSPKGVPDSLNKTVFTVSQIENNDIYKFVNENNIGILVVEFARYEFLPQESIQIIKNLQESGCLIVADEVTSGLRVKNKLAVSNCNINPDILVLGKSLGGGWPIAGVGCKSLLKNKLEEVFASSTFWTEQIGFLAARQLLNEIKNYDHFYKKLEKISLSIKRELEFNFVQNGIEYKINSIATMISFKFNFKGLDERESSALLSDFMLDKGFLFSSTIYPTIAHDKFSIKKFGQALSQSLQEINLLIKDNKDLKEHISKLGFLEKGFSRTQRL